MMNIEDANQGLPSAHKIGDICIFQPNINGEAVHGTGCEITAVKCGGGKVRYDIDVIYIEREETHHLPLRDVDSLMILKYSILSAQANDAKAQEDAERFRWDHSDKRTSSNAIVKLEIRRLSGDYPTLDEVRAAFDEAMSMPAIDAARQGMQTGSGE